MNIIYIYIYAYGDVSMCQNLFLTVFGGFKHPAKPAMTWGSIVGYAKPSNLDLF